MSTEHWLWPDSTVTRVIDGDSIVAQLTKDIGFHGSTTFRQKLRIARINALPKSSTSGRSATAFLIELVTNVSVFIETTGPYKYRDEWMAEITLPDGRNVADALVEAKLAVYWDGTGPRPDTPILKPL